MSAGLPSKGYYIRLDTTLADIGEPFSCAVCGWPTEKALIDYAVGNRVIVEVLQAPGYRCTNFDCRDEYISNEAAIEILGKAAEILSQNGDPEGAASLYEVQSNEIGWRR